MRNTTIEALDHVARPMIAVGNVYPDGFRLAPHRHRRGQLLCGTTGVLTVTTPQGRWVMPPLRGIWVPGGIEHEVRMQGAVATRSLYVDDARGLLPQSCQVLAITPLLQALMAEAVDVPVDYEFGSRADALMQLIRHELPLLAVLPLSLPFPADVRLLRLCKRFLRNPSIHSTIDKWRKNVDMSRRAFTRLFRQQTGLTLATWCRQACLVTAMPRLVAGEAITVVAADLGYENPAAFTTMFKSAFGASPRAYLKLEQPSPSRPTAPTSGESFRRMSGSHEHRS
jgi:AraC-like DNA-binding protein